MYFSGDAFFVGASTVMGDLDEDDAPSTPLLLLLVVFLLGCRSESFEEALHDWERDKVAAQPRDAICCTAVVTALKLPPPSPQRVPRSCLFESLKCCRPEKNTHTHTITCLPMVDLTPSK